MIVPTGRIASLRLSAVEVRNLEVALLDLPAGVSLDGLLGVNVLERFRVTFDLSAHGGDMESGHATFRRPVDVGAFRDQQSCQRDVPLPSGKQERREACL